MEERERDKEAGLYLAGVDGLDQVGDSSPIPCAHTVYLIHYDELCVCGVLDVVREGRDEGDSRWEFDVESNQIRPTTPFRPSVHKHLYISHLSKGEKSRDGLTASLKSNRVDSKIQVAHLVYFPPHHHHHTL